MIWFVVPRPGASFAFPPTEVWFIEGKNGLHATLTPSEERMRELIEGAEGRYHVVRSVDDVERLLRR